VSYARTLEEHRRLAVLTHLADAPGHASNADILYDVVNGVGIATARDVLAASLAWLAEGGLLTLEDRGVILVATATARGLDVASGRAQHPGVKRPAPRG